jgi:cytochrome c556
MLIKTTLTLCTALMSLGVFAPAAFANDEGEIKYRKSVMKSVGGHMGAIVGIMKTETANAAHLQLHADAIANLSSIVPDLFPAGSDFGADTTVLPVIWQKPDDFAKAVKQLQDAAADMSAAAKTGDMAQVGPAIGKLGESCKNCHENFREKKEEPKK